MTTDKDERIIYVDRDWYIQLAEYLKTEERWSSADHSGNLILYTPPRRRLIFICKDATKEEQ